MRPSSSFRVNVAGAYTPPFLPFLLPSFPAALTHTSQDDEIYKQRSLQLLVTAACVAARRGFKR